MNPLLNKLQPYPFERLRKLLQGVEGSPHYRPLNLSIGEPKHPTPELLITAMRDGLSGLATYPATAGTPALREAIAAWLARRYGLPGVDPASQVLPVNGSREALFAFAQSVMTPGSNAWLVCPNPFYQIYEGAALLAGGRPWFINQVRSDGYRCNWDRVPDAVWRDTQLVYVCSPGNPTGAVLTLDDWTRLFALSDRYGFIIGSDECYSEIYGDEAAPPLGALQAAHLLGRTDFRRLVVFSSLSKRSNAPGLRSGFVAGDAQLLKAFLLYRTYHGGAMSPTVQLASIAAWTDEAHVMANRAAYRAKYDAVTPLISSVMRTERPEAGFYLWAEVPDGNDTRFCQELLRQYNVLVLPGSFLAREHDGCNPGAGFVRLALVDTVERCEEAAQRIVRLISG